MYGRTPEEKINVTYETLSENPNFLNGKAICKQVKFTFTGNKKKHEALLMLVLPNQPKEKVPVFVSYNYKCNHSTISDTSIILPSFFSLPKTPDYISLSEADRKRGCQSNRWCYDKIIDRGYGIATMFYQDIYPDVPDKEEHGIVSLFSDYNSGKKSPSQWQALGAWAWGTSRIADYLETQERVDTDKIIIMGHSRHGKAALWAGAQDKRFAVVISNNSGCGGAALSKRVFGENIAVITDYFPHWFCPAFNQYANNEVSLPFDQHELVSLIAPRKVYIASAVEDEWADPKGEFLSGYHAGPVYELYGLKGLETDVQPPLNQPVMNDAGYHIREGGHNVTDYDWMRYMDFADRHFGNVVNLHSIVENTGQRIIDLGNRREIFVDDYFIDKLDGLRLQMHAPHDEGPVLFFDKPCEGAFSGYVTVIKENDIYRAYYRGSPIPDGREKEHTCYAESKDGIHWEKPNLKIYRYNGSLDNNLILADADPVTHNFCPFLDANPQALPSQKYKAVGGSGRSGLIAYVSADGIKWTKLRNDGIIKDGDFDSQNVVFWSESEKRYLCYFRTSYQGFRSVSRTTSTDFVNWTKPEIMTFGDTQIEHLYTHQTSPYFRAPHIYVAIGGRFLPKRQILTEEQAKKLNVDPKHFNDCSDAFFMTSRGGNRYSRTFMESFIRPGIGLNNWVSRTNYPALNVVQTGPAEMSVYVNQDYAQPTNHLRRYSLRLDGFTSINAPYSGGEVLTKFFTFSGNQLEINYSTSAAGELRFEIQDEKGVAIPGFTLNDSEIIIGNEISRTVSWKGKALQKITPKVIRLRIYMKDADLYSIGFKD
jgi:hypothetical protein